MAPRLQALPWRARIPLAVLALAGAVRCTPPTFGPQPALQLRAGGRVHAHEECDVTRFGARGDNRTEATSAFGAAIEACAGRGGGAVVVPPGTYLLRPVKLVSHTALVIQQGATLLAWPGVGWRAGWPNSTSETCIASPYETKSPVVLPQLESLLYADGVVNVSVSGGGRLDGQGWRWWPLRDKSQYWHHCKPHLIRIDCGNSTNTSTGVSIDNLALHNSPHFNIHAYADNARYTRINTTADTCPLNTDSFNIGGDQVSSLVGTLPILAVTPHFVTIVRLFPWESGLIV